MLRERKKKGKLKKSIRIMALDKFAELMTGALSLHSTVG